MSLHDLAEDNKSLAANKSKALEATAAFVVIFSIFYPIIVISYSFFGGFALQLGSSLIGAAVFVLMFFKKTRMSGEKKLIMLSMVFLLVLCGWYGALWTSMRSYGVVIVFVSCLGVAWATLEYRLSKYVYEYPFYMLLIITSGLIVVGTDRYEFNEILAVGSRNVYSAILLAFAIGYLFSRKIRGKATSIILGVTLIIVSFFLYSRTGLVLAFGLFFVFAVGSGLVRPWFIVFWCLLATFFVSIAFDIGDFVVRNSNFEKGMDSPRFAIWRSYFFDVEAFNLFFGYNLEDNELINDFGGNPHSAYLRLHSYFGVGLFCLLFYSLLSTLKLASGRRWCFVFLMCCFYFRAIFDPVYFIWVFDYIFYPFVFFVFFDDYFSDLKVKIK